MCCLNGFSSSLIYERTMKTIQLAGSSASLHQEPRRVPPYMAALFRRYRFVIIATICFTVVLLYSWHLHRTEKSFFYDGSYSYSIEEIQMLETIEQYYYDSDEIYNTIETGEPQIINMKELFQNKENSPFVPPIIKQMATVYQVTEQRHLFPIKQATNVLTTKATKQIEEQYNQMIGDEKALSILEIQQPEIESSLISNSSETAVNEKFELWKKYLISEKYQNDYNFASMPLVQKTGDGFPAPEQDNEKEIKDGVAYPLLRNITDTTAMLSKNTDITFHWKEKFLIKSNFTDASKNSPLLIDTPGCKIPRLDPWDSTVKHFIELQDPYVCPGPPVFMKSNPGGSITFNKTILENFYNITAEELNCEYQSIHRAHEEGRVREISVIPGRFQKLEFGVPLLANYVAVYCNISGKTYEQYFPLVRLKKHVEEVRNYKDPADPSLNVILIGVDSVSKLNFLRHFPRTRAFLNEKLKPFEMNGYNKVGDNTFPNLVPLLTGQFVDYWWNETLMDSMYFDDVGFIWKEYAKKGYRTFYAEDSPFTGTFNYFKRGFYDPPTDYYFRPMALYIEGWKIRSPPKKEFCLNSQIEFDIIYDHLLEFTQTMESRPYFGFSMVSTITHDDINKAGWADEPTQRLLEGLMKTGALNNTLLVLFSDHGLRYGKIRHTYVGKFEDKLPLMYIHAPKWFLDQHPKINQNLKINQNRLMTLFDVHATMLHLLDLNKTQEERSKFTRGKSLFEELSPNRTCPDAHIETHICPCQTFDIVNLYSSEVINASRAIVKDINYKLEPYSEVCEVLEVDSVLDARVGKANELMLQYLGAENEVVNKTLYFGDAVPSLDDYMITVVTKPGGAVFDGTVRHNPDENSYSAVGLSRISMYGNSSWCIDSQKLKLFCYCKIQQE